MAAGLTFKVEHYDEFVRLTNDYVANNLNNIVAEFLTEYSEELQKKADEVTEKVANDFAKELKTVTPRSESIVSEHLADSIKVTAKKQKGYGKTTTARYIHFNKWQIAHLLEFGWTLKNGQKLTREPFVRPLFDRNKDRYYRMYKEELKK